MKKITICLLLSMLFSNIDKAFTQDFLPFANNNYGGVNNVFLQPASIADSRFIVDINIAAIGLSVNNNFASISRDAMFNPQSFMDEIDSNGVTDNKYLRFDKNNGKDKSAYVNINVIGPSFMFSINRKNSIAITSRFRTIVNIDNVNEDAVNIALDPTNTNPLMGQRLNNVNFSMQQSSWVEYGLSYGRVIFDAKKHALKAGVTVKFVQGLGASYAYLNDVNYQIDPNYNFGGGNVGTAVSIYNSMVRYGMSSNVNVDKDNLPTYSFIANPTVGIDFGIVYEFRPKYLKYKYDMDGKTNLWMRNKEKYLVKVGFSVLDIGRVKYEKAEGSMDFVANVDHWDVGNVMPHSVNSLNDTLRNRFGTASDNESTFNMNLPTVISTQVDLRVVEGLYLNFTSYWALNQGSKDVNKMHALTTYSLTPRYDVNWFGIAIPFQYNQYNQFNIGLGIRLGPMWIGSNDLISSLTYNDFRYGGDIQVAFKIPIPYGKIRDKDKDKVSNKKDKCKDVPGVWLFRGCPDTDNDSIPDAEDDCPTVAGLKAFRGCPDRDGDGIIDKNDLCPDEKGTIEFQGCPDRDGDKIIDREDSCPDVKGLLRFHGCPDSDNDGIIDKLDECPTDSGLAVFKGCPDRDGDGVRDKDDLCPDVPGLISMKGCPFVDTDGDGLKDEDDACPNVPGPIENKGCPYSDTDGDGIPDKDDACPTIKGLALFNGCPDTDGDGISDPYDHCPTIPGVPENYGCPKIEKEAQEIINTAFENLEFQTGKAIIKATSFSSLDKLAELLKKKTDWKLLISGHTDNVGTVKSNMTLSKNRANALKNYMVKKGININRLKAEWFGPNKPVGDNTTSEGRQKNRRVEMTIMFE